MRFCWFISILLLLLPCFAQAQTGLLTVDVPYKKMGIHDKMDVVYTYTYHESMWSDSLENIDLFAEDSTVIIDSLRERQPEAHYDVNFKDFFVIKGPVTVLNSSQTLTGLRYTRTSCYSLTYTIQPKKTGVLKIPAMVMKLGGTVYGTTRPVAITVVRGSIRPMPGSIRRALPVDSAIIKTALKKMPGSYLVSTGVLSPLSTSDSLKTTQLLNTQVELLNMLSPCTDLGTFYCNGIPRRYLIVKDTTGVRNNLDVIYRHNNAISFYTNIFTAKNWVCKTELQVLKNQAVKAGQQQAEYIERKR